MLTIIENNGKVLGIHDGYGSVVGDEIQIKGKKVYKPASRVGIHFVPDQDVSSCYQILDGGLRVIVAQWPSGFEQFSTEEQSRIVDKETEQAINNRVHEQASVGEQMGMVRNLCVLLANHVGMEVPEEFAKWNEIAIAEIEAGVVKKAAITDA